MEDRRTAKIRSLVEQPWLRQPTFVSPCHAQHPDQRVCRGI